MENQAEIKTPKTTKQGTQRERDEEPISSSLNNDNPTNNNPTCAVCGKTNPDHYH